MKKRSSPRKAKKSAHKRKSAVYYIRISFVSLLAGLVVFVVASNYFSRDRFECANSLTCKSDLTSEIDNNTIGVFQGKKVIPPKIDLAMDSVGPSILGANSPDEDKHIYVDLSKQTLSAYQGDNLVMKTFISSGKWGRTPTGNFNIWTKLRATRMAGGSGADAYNLPNVPYVMYFYRDFGLHGAYWHNNFGHEMSHGCVNMRIIDAKALFEWADGPAKDNKGTPVSICNSITAENKCIQENPVK